MQSKIINFLLILAILNLCGCYSAEVITKQQLDSKNADIDFTKALIVTTHDHKSYQFAARFYHIKNDTLYGEGRQIPDQKPFNGKIAMNDIETFEQEQMDTAATVGLVLGIVIIAGLVGLLITLDTMSDAFKI